MTSVVRFELREARSYSLSAIQLLVLNPLAAERLVGRYFKIGFEGQERALQFATTIARTLLQMVDFPGAIISLSKSSTEVHSLLARKAFAHEKTCSLCEHPMRITLQHLQFELSFPPRFQVA